MKVWVDLLSGDEMVSDSYPISVEFEGAGLKVKGRFKSKNNNEDFGISSTFPFYLTLLNRQ